MSNPFLLPVNSLESIGSRLIPCCMDVVTMRPFQPPLRPRAMPATDLSHTMAVGPGAFSGIPAKTSTWTAFALPRRESPSSSTWCASKGKPAGKQKSEPKNCGNSGDWNKPEPSGDCHEN